MPDRRDCPDKEQPNKKVDKEQLNLAKSKLADTLHRSGIANGRAGKQPGQVHPQHVQPAASPYTQYTGAVAGAAMQLRQGGADLAERQAAIAQPHGGQGGGKRGGGKGSKAPSVVETPTPPPPPHLSKRAQKRQNYVDSQKAAKFAKKGK